MTATIIVLIFGIAAWIAYKPETRSTSYMIGIFLGVVICLGLIWFFMFGIFTQHPKVPVLSGQRIERGDM